MVKIQYEINNGQRIVGLILVLVGIFLCFTIVGAVIGIPLMIVGIIVKRLAYKKFTYEK